MACSAELHTKCADSELKRRHAGLRTRNLDVKALQAVFELLQSHYPERLHALWFLNAPFIFWGVWRMVRLLGNHLLCEKFPTHLHPYKTALRTASFLPLAH